MLHSDNAPFHPDAKGDDYYAPKFRTLKEAQEDFVPRYKIEFTPPAFSEKIKYYKRLIDNCICIELNSQFKELQETSDARIAYRTNKLFKEVKSLLEETKRIIELNQYDLSVITSPFADFATDVQHKECTYIFHYLQTALIRCYMEFQQHFIADIKEDKKLSIANFYTQILKKQVLQNTFIKELQSIEILPTEKQIQSIPVKRDKTNETLSFVYINLDKNPEAITNLFNSLRDVAKLIDTQTKLIDFKKVFSGKEVTQPIVWLGTPTELYYFIKYIHNIQKSVEDSKKQQWAIACHCFVGENNVRFDKVKLKALKSPAEKSKTKIERSANNLTI